MRRKYSNPPVVEALCEVYFRASEWDTTIPGIFYERVRDQFPKKGERKGVAIELNLKDEVLATRAKRPETRSQFSRLDGSRMLQVERDLIVVNQLRPYPHFQEWRPAVIQAAALYGELAQPDAVARIGVRYINRIEVPRETLKMEDYFQLYAEIPEQLGAAHGSFMIRVEIPSRHEGHQLLITFGSAPEHAQGSQAFLLDLYDLFVPLGDGSIDSIGTYLDEAHGNIERAFEAIITDATRTLFGEN